MTIPQTHFTLNNIAEIWKIKINELVLFATEGNLAVLVMHPEVQDDLPVFEAADWTEVCAQSITAALAKGNDFFDNGHVINYNKQLKAFKRTNFSDLVISEKEKIRFEQEHLTKPSASKDSKGEHWGQKRFEILCAALQIINGEIGNAKSDIFKGNLENKKINSSKLAAYISDNRHKWGGLKEEVAGTTLNNITKTIQDALKEK